MLLILCRPPAAEKCQTRSRRRSRTTGRLRLMPASPTPTRHATVSRTTWVNEPSAAQCRRKVMSTFVIIQCFLPSDQRRSSSLFPLTLSTTWTLKSGKNGHRLFAPVLFSFAWVFTQTNVWLLINVWRTGNLQICWALWVFRGLQLNSHLFACFFFFFPSFWFHHLFT